MTVAVDTGGVPEKPAQPILCDGCSRRLSQSNEELATRMGYWKSARSLLSNKGKHELEVIEWPEDGAPVAHDILELAAWLAGEEL